MAFFESITIQLHKKQLVIKGNILFFLFSVFLTAFGYTEEAPSRKWSNASGDKSFEGVYLGIKDGKVKIKKGLTEYEVPMTSLHKDDQSWVREYENKQTKAELSEQGVFDGLQFGDSHNTVLNKLRKSSITISNVGDGIFDGLTGISGKFQTKKRIGDLQCYLHFKWNKESGKTLSGLELKSDTVTAPEIDTVLKESWTEMIELFSILHGEASHAATNYPTFTDIRKAGGFAGTHRWNIPTAEIIVGPALDEQSSKYFLYVKIEQKN